MSFDEFSDESNPYRAPEADLEVGAPKESPDLGPTPNPFLTLWTRPKATIRYLVETDPTRHVLLLAILGGINGGLGNAVQQSLGDRLPLPGVLLAAVTGGAIGGLLWLYLFGALLQRVGQWFGGLANQEQVRTVIAWSALPNICGMIFWPLELALFGGEIFQSTEPGAGADPELETMFMTIGVIELVVGLTLAIWSLFLFCHGLGEVHQFSAWKAFGVSIVAFLVLLVIIIGLAFIIGIFVAAVTMFVA